MANDLGLIIKESFYFLTACLLVAFVMESIFPNIILAYFNLNYLVLVWLIFGLLSLNFGRRSH
jgi:hypothetical protein